MLHYAVASRIGGAWLAFHDIVGGQSPDRTVERPVE
jgi:hypothetical protein